MPFNLFKKPTGLIEGKEDSRDFSIKDIVGYEGAINLPPSFNLTPADITNQGNTQHCTSHAAIAAKEPYDEAEHKKDLHFDPVSLWKKQKEMGEAHESTGATLSSAVKVLKNHGANEKENGGKMYPIDGYARCEVDVEVMKYFLSKGYYLYTGMRWRKNDWYPAKKDGILRSGGGSYTSGHAFTLIGYDDNKDCYDGRIGAFKFQNSYGDTWGDKGFGWISYKMCHMPTFYRPYIFYDSKDPVYIFKDITDKSPHAEEFQEAKDLGLIQGFPDGSYRPDKGLSRREAMLLILRLYHLTKK